MGLYSTVINRRSIGRVRPPATEGRKYSKSFEVPARA
jgi:hypothetical protein